MNNSYEPVRLQALINKASSLPPVNVAVVDAGEEHVLKGAFEAADAGLIVPILIGKQSVIHAISDKLGHSSRSCTIIESSSEDDAAQKGIELVQSGEAQALAKGWIHTDALMRPVLKHLRTSRRVSHVFIADLPSYHKLLFITDAAINIEPDLLIKAEIVQNAVDLARILGVDRPKVAALSAIEVVKPAISSTCDAACLSKMAQRRQIKNAIVDGPLAFDNAISRQAAQIKQIDSEVSGDTDIMLAPDLAAGNILAKDIEYLANATLAGIVIGAQVPVILTSRSDGVIARLASAAVCSLIHQRWNEMD
ncbi:MAG TPA: bifunctional enoyl-CoA hydratase/phosphate acetyltransferase [Crenotrichaceae bacterium]|nr:bifunctional enoyl-CoA hydratase/phosphate acetyltransferase [Crenotrichaceae bacterium]